MGILRRMFGGDQLESVVGDSSLSAAIKLTSEGNHHGGRGKFDRAIACFRKALAARPDHVPAHVGLATAYREQGDFQRALDVLSDAPSESSVGQPMDFKFEIAFQKVSVYLAKYKQSGFHGEMPDLVAALEEAQEFGRTAQMTESSRSLASALGMDVVADRQEQISMVNSILSELQNSR